jgi:RNA polymerase sigma-70 factor (ECF subfamily)
MAEIPDTRASLLVRLRNPQDETAWTEFVDLYAPLVYAYARKQGLQDADAADLSQDVLLAFAGAVSRLEYDPRRGSFRNYLYTVVRHKLSDWRSAGRNRTRGSGDTDTRRVLEQHPASEEVAEWETEWQLQVFTWACEQVRREVANSTWQAFWRTADGESCKDVRKTSCAWLARLATRRPDLRTRTSREFSKGCIRPSFLGRPPPRHRLICTSCDHRTVRKSSAPWVLTKSWRSSVREGWGLS